MVFVKDCYKTHWSFEFVKHLEFSSKTEEKIHKKLEGSLSPETDLSPTAKDQVEMYVVVVIILDPSLFSPFTPIF